MREMEFDIAAWLSRLRTYYQGLDLRRRRNWLLIIVFFILTVAVLSIALLNPRYQMVFSNLGTKSAGQIAQKLGSMKIPYRLQGNNILVPASDANKVRIDMAMVGLPSSGYVDYSQIFQQGNIFGLSSQELNLQTQSILQDRIAQAIDSINGVNSAVVNIVPAQTQTFLDPGVDLGAKASVVLDIAPGTALLPGQVTGIQELVAHSVSGLSAASVSVVDQYGNDLSSISAAGAASTLSGGIQQELAVRQQLAASVRQELDASLQSFVGQGNVSVVVNPIVSFNQVQRQQHQVTAGPALSAQASSSSAAGVNGTGGVVGQAGKNPNLPAYAPAGTNGGTSANRSSTTNYDNNYVNTVTTYAPMQLAGFSVSVLLNTKAVRLTPALTKQIHAYIQAAVSQGGAGVNAASISILGVPFAATAGNLAMPSGFGISPYVYGGVGGAALLAGGLLLYAMRSRRRNRTTEEALDSLSMASLSGPAPEPLELSIARKLQELAQRRPEAFASLLRSWLEDE